jgi:phosphate/phosphite/phosphonate ABC transporter binding protein
MEPTMKMLCRAVTALVVLVGCATTSGASSGSKVTVTSLPPLSLGLVSYSGAATASSDAQSLQTLLSQRLGRDVTTRVFPAEAELSSAVAAGTVDLAWLPPFAFVEAESKGKVTPIVKIARHGLPFYRGVLFVKSASKVSSLKDLQGLKAGWVEKNSAAGYLFPRAIIRQAGLKPAELFKREIFLGDHAAVCKAVLDGQVDVGATYADDRPKGQPVEIDGCVQASGAEAAKGLRVIATSAPIPNDVIAARPELPPADISRIREIFQGFKPTGDEQKILSVFKAESFVEVGAEDFEPVRFAADAAK